MKELDEILASRLTMAIAAAHPIPLTFDLAAEVVGTIHISIVEAAAQRLEQIGCVRITRQGRDPRSWRLALYASAQEAAK